MAARHVDGGSPTKVGDRSPVRRWIALTALRGEKHKRRSEAPIRQGHASGCGSPAGRSDAGNNREPNTGRPERVHLLARASEDGSVSTFQADHCLSGSGVDNEPSVDLIL